MKKDKASLNRELDRLITEGRGASDSRYLGKIALTIKSGADANYVADNLGWTALMYATALNDSYYVKRFIGLGADVNCQSPTGMTAISLSVVRECPESLMALLESGADFNVVDADGDTALMLAAEYNKELFDIIQNHISRKEAEASSERIIDIEQAFGARR